MKPSAPPLPSQEDEDLIQDYVLLTMLESVLERDIRVLQSLKLKMADLYVLNLQHAGKNNADQLRSVRQRMRRRGIRILASDRSAGRIEVRFLCRGYERALVFDADACKQEAAVRIGRYLGTDLAAY